MSTNDHSSGALTLICKSIGIGIISASVLAFSCSIANSQVPLHPLQQQEVDAAARRAVEEANNKNVPETREDQWIRIQMSRGLYTIGSRNGRSYSHYKSGQYVNPKGQVYQYKGKSKGEVEAFLRSQWAKWFAKSE